MKKTKKGFTIVELVIVIAVIGILAAILIPTFVNVTQQAQEVANKQNVANAFSAYMADAIDEKIDDDHAYSVTDKKEGALVYAEPVKAQTEYVVVFNNEKYTYDVNEGWKIPDAAPTLGTKIANYLNNAETPVKTYLDFLTYNNAAIYFKA